MDDDGSDVFFPPRTAVSAASSLRVRINGNKWYHICTADCVGSLRYTLGLFVSTFVCVFFFFLHTGVRRSCLRVGACLPRSEAGAPGV